MEMHIWGDEICSSEFPLTPLQSCIWRLPSSWPDRAQRSRKMSAPSQLAWMYANSVPEVWITSGMWQKWENILAMVAPVFSASKFPVHCITDLAITLTMKTGHWDWVTVITFLKRWGIIYSPSLRAGFYNERAIALRVSSGDPRPVA